MKRDKLVEDVKQQAIQEVVGKHMAGGSQEQKIAFGRLLEEMLDAFMQTEREIFLSKDPADKGNGFYGRSLSTALGKLGISVPRDRDNKFRPSILPDLWVRSTDSYEDLLVSLIVNGHSRAEMVNTLKGLGLPYSEDEIEKIWEGINHKLEEFKTRELPEKVFVIYIDAYHTQIKDKTGKIKKGCIYTVLGIDLEGNREVYGFYILFGSESKAEWIKIYNDLISRGLKRVLLIVSDDLAGLDEAISALFEKTDHQLCYVHLQRNVQRNMSKTDASEFNQKLRQIRLYSKDYDQAKAQMDELFELYKDKYPKFIGYIARKEERYLSFMKYPESVRKHIYTTNFVESFNGLLEKMRIRLGGYFASEDILGINIMLQCQRLAKGKWLKPHPIIRGATYEINQLFNLRFQEKE